MAKEKKGVRLEHISKIYLDPKTKKEFYAVLNKLLPKKHYKRAKYVLSLANKKFQIFLKYNVVQAVITGAGTFLFMLVTGIPYKISITLLEKNFGEYELRVKDSGIGMSAEFVKEVFEPF
ncbi:MAG: hypothetical protein IJH98_07605, partial [Solobacterium sp.]|nr:hypothetical protein [Solobacterium sp.]